MQRLEEAVSTMMTSFRVKNYKCLADVELKLTPIHVIIGQNDSGKSALLEAMLSLHTGAQGEMRAAFPGTWVGRELVNEKAIEPLVEFEAEFSYGPDGECLTYHVGALFPSGESPDRTCRRTDEFMEFRGQRHLASKQPYDPTKTVERGDDLALGASERRIIAEAIGSAHLYRFDPKLMATPAALDEKRRFRMDADGFGLATLLDDILGHKAERFIELRQEFLGYYPEFRTVGIESITALQRTEMFAGMPQTSPSSGKGIFFETTNGQKIRAQQASDGAILFLGFLALMYNPVPPKLLLIEEPERGVYPKRLEQVIDLLKKLGEVVSDRDLPQIILTTHSPYLLSSFQPEQVTLMSREGGSGPVRARALRDAPNIHERMGGEFYLGELWYNMDEEELFAHGRR